MKRWVATALIVLTALAAAAALWVYFWLHRPLDLATDTVETSIELGTSPRNIANAWVEAGVRAPAWLLYEWFRWSGESRRIRAGSYEIDRQTTPVSLLGIMVRGDESKAFVRLNEGWTLQQFRAELAHAEALKPTTAAMSNAELMAALGDASTPAEGRFYPDTYSYSKGSADIAVLRRAHHAIQQRLAAAWAARATDTPLRTP